MGWIYKLVKLSPHVSLLISSIPKLWDINRTKEVIVDKFSKDRSFQFIAESSLLQRYSQSRRLLSYRPFRKKPPTGTTPRGRSSIDGFMVGTVERWNSTSQIMEWP